MPYPLYSMFIRLSTSSVVLLILDWPYPFIGPSSVVLLILDWPYPFIGPSSVVLLILDFRDVALHNPLQSQMPLSHYPANHNQLSSLILLLTPIRHAMHFV